MKRIILSLFFLLALSSNAFCAAITSAGSGNWSATGTWTGGVVPGTGDTVTIGSGHTVTVDQNITIGTGSGVALTINGKIDWPYTVAASYTFTINGGIGYADGGEIDIGSSANPLVNYSATLLLGGNVENEPLSRKVLLKCYGASKTYWYSIASAISVGDKSITTADSTSWAVGDKVLVPGTNGTANRTEEVTITGISGTTIYIDSNGNGTGASPTFAYTHEASTPVFNMTRNITIGSTTTGTRQFGKYDGAGNTYIGSWVEFKYVMLWGSSYTFQSFENCVFRNISPPNGYGGIAIDPGVTTLNYNIFYQVNSNSYGSGAVHRVYNYNSQLEIDFTKRVYNKNAFIRNTCAVGGAQGSNFKDSWFYDNDRVFGNHDGYGFSGYLAFTNCKMRNNGRIVQQPLTRGTQPTFLFGCDLGTTLTSEWDTSSYGDGKFYLHGTLRQSVPSATSGGSGTYFHCEQDANAIAGRYGCYKKYGSISDQVTGGQAASWARGGSGLNIYLNPTSTTEKLYSTIFIPVTASTDPQIKFYVKTTQTSSGPTLNIDVYDSDDDSTLLVNNASVTLTSASDWTQYSIASISPSSTGFVRVVLKALNGSSTGDIGIDDISFVSGGTTFTDTCDRSADGAPLVFGVGAGGSPTASTHGVGMAF